MSAELEREILRLRTAVGFVLHRIDGNAAMSEVRALIADINYQSSVRASQRAGVEHDDKQDGGARWQSTI